MRTRLATIAVLSLAAVLGTANVAHAKPAGPGGLDSKPTTTTTAAPKGPDKLGPTPTTQPPKGPGDIAQPQGNDPQPPKGPGDLAQPQPGPVVDPQPEPAPPLIVNPPKGDNGGGGTTQGDDEAGVGWDQPDVNPDGSLVNGESVETVPVANTGGVASNDESTEAASTAGHDGGVSPFLMLGIAAAVAGLIGLGFAARRRNDEQDAEQF
jgi:hypothetical protein